MTPEPHHVVLHRPGPRWQAEVPAFEQDGLDAHLAHYGRLAEDGLLLAGGPFLDADSGGMMIVTPALGGEEVQAYAAADPSVQSGLLTVSVRPWLLGLAST